MATKGRNFRLDDTSLVILRRHAERLGISETDVLKIALRDYDKAQGSPPTENTTDEHPQPRRKRSAAAERRGV